MSKNNSVKIPKLIEQLQIATLMLVLYKLLKFCSSFLNIDVNIMLT